MKRKLQNFVTPSNIDRFSNVSYWCTQQYICNIYTVFHKKNTPLGFLFYLSQMLLIDSENWNKYSPVK